MWYFFKNRSNYKADIDADEAFDVKNCSIIAPEYQDEADPNEQQFYEIILQQTGDNDDAKEGAPANEHRVPVNNAEDRATANDAEDENPANDAEDENQSNDTEQEIPANVQSDLVTLSALPETSGTSGPRQSWRHENAEAVYEVLDGPKNILGALQSAECDMWEGAIEFEFKPLADYSTFE